MPEKTDLEKVAELLHVDYSLLCTLSHLVGKGGPDRIAPAADCACSANSAACARSFIGGRRDATSTANNCPRASTT